MKDKERKKEMAAVEAPKKIHASAHTAA